MPDYRMGLSLDVRELFDERDRRRHFISAFEVFPVFHRDTSNDPGVCIRIDLGEFGVVYAETLLSMFITAAEQMGKKFGDPRGQIDYERH